MPGVVQLLRLLLGELPRTPVVEAHLCLPIAEKRSLAFAGAGAAKLTDFVALESDTNGWLPLIMVNGAAGEMLTLSQCQVSGPQLPLKSQALSGLYEWSPSWMTPWLKPRSETFASSHQMLYCGMPNLMCVD